MNLLQKARVHVRNLASHDRGLAFKQFLLRKGGRLIPGLWVEYYLEGALEPEVSYVLSMPKRGQVVVDAGAFRGKYTVRLAKRGCLVHAFEPNPVALKLLSKRAGRFSNVTVYPMALAEFDGFLDFRLNPAAPAASSGSLHIGPTVRVPCRRLDSMTLRPSWMKLDVEGFEERVLRGSEKTILKNEPKIVVECHGSHNFHSVTEYLEGLRYNVSVLQQTRFRDGDPVRFPYDMVTHLFAFSQRSGLN